MPVGNGARDLRHLQELGITAVELLPVHYHLNDRHLVEKGLTNYWGYNTFNYLRPKTIIAPLPNRH